MLRILTSDCRCCCCLLPVCWLHTSPVESSKCWFRWGGVDVIASYILVAQNWPTFCWTKFVLPISILGLHFSSAAAAAAAWIFIFFGSMTKECKICLRFSTSGKKKKTNWKCRGTVGWCGGYTVWIKDKYRHDILNEMTHSTWFCYIWKFFLNDIIGKVSYDILYSMVCTGDNMSV